VGLALLPDIHGMGQDIAGSARYGPFRKNRSAAADHRLGANTSTSLVAGFLLREVPVWIDAPSITMFWSRAANTLDMRNAAASSSVLSLATAQKRKQDMALHPNLW
jgi:hypothetical protein